MFGTRWLRPARTLLGSGQRHFGRQVLRVVGLAGVFGLLLPVPASAQVVFSEIMYHPVEEPAFNADGSPVLDLYEDVHEFIEIYNAGAQDVSLDAWEITGGISYSFPRGSSIRAGQYLVVAKDPQRLAAVPAYHLSPEQLLGPWQGQLSNRRDTIRLRDAQQQVVDAVTYSAEFPWAIGADALGAGDLWTGLKRIDYQYRGRSLERVSFTHSANDPANWLASPMPGNPSPGQPNAIRREVPRPVVISFSVTQESNESPVIRNNQSVVVRCTFSGTNDLSSASLEWFVDNVETTNEATTITAMVPDAPAFDGHFRATLPGQADRRVVRYRFRADRGAGDEVVSPRSDDPYAWHAYFVTPTRTTSTRPIYDLFISSASLNTLATNISQNPRRVTRPDPPGYPRSSWNASEPAILVYSNVVYDIWGHYQGSRYNRGSRSWQWHFPEYRKLNGVTALMVTSKNQDTVIGQGLFAALGLPESGVRWVDLCQNNNSVSQRLEVGEFDSAMLDTYHRKQQALNPGSALEPTGDIHKDTGTIDMNGEGPYGRGDGRRLSKPPYWTDLQMYDWTYPLENHGWRGSYEFKRMIDAFWQARGDAPTALHPDIPAMRTFFTEYWDIDEMLNYIALENWCCPWDDTTQNHFLWQRRNGKWGMLPWDMDAWFGTGDNTPATSSIYIGEVGDPNNNSRGPNFFKDGFIKAFRPELKERFFLLNNTLLHPDNLQAMGYSAIVGFARTRFQTVNQKCGLGEFQRPNKPTALFPANGGAALPPMSMTVSAYSHTTNPTPAHLKTLWEIRLADGSYDTPVWRLTSTTNLTSVPIPFEKLAFGQTYGWRCTFYDADGHPSLLSDEARFRFGPAPVERQLISIDASTIWQYDQSGTDWSKTNWTSLAFNDQIWSSGPGLLAKEEAALPAPIRTPLTLGKTTYYFRHKFGFPGDPQGARLRLQLVLDDGGVVYLNGQEVFRLRMPQGPVNYTTFANTTVGNAVAEGPFDISAAPLRRGENIIAVEVHQVNASSSDIVFGLSLDASIAGASGGIVLNEIAARNSGSVTHGGQTPDWIELFNPGSETIDLGGMSLSDDVLQPTRYVFPPNTPIAPQGFLVVWCDKATNTAGLHTGFALNQQGQTVALFAPGPDGLTVQDYVTYGLQSADLTIGRVPNGQGAWQLTLPTPGAPNEAQALAEPVNLKINEWMAAGNGADWLELYNSADLPVSLGGLYLTDNFQNPTNTRIADRSFIGAHDFAVFQADGQLAQGANHADFNLSANGEQIGLYAADGLTRLDGVVYGIQTANVSEGRLPDGSANRTFFPTTASPGQSNFLPSAPGRLMAVADLTQGALQLSLEGSGTGTMILQGSADLKSWVNLQTNTVSTGLVQFNEPILQGNRSQFYRVLLSR